MNVSFYANPHKPAAREAAVRFAETARRHALAVAGDPAAADVVIVLGGDGTILKAVHLFPDKPLLGFNLGGLGYLSSVGSENVDEAFSLLTAGRFRTGERSMLQARKRGADAPCVRALNDLVVMRELSGHAAILDLDIDGRRATQYMADGLVVATPTGSTAYSLAAGGPVLVGDTASFVVTPMNPHALAVRPAVVSERVRLSVTSRRRVNGSAEKIGVYADGESVFSLDVDETLDIVKAPEGARIVELDGYDPYEVLSRKLGWPGGTR